MTVSTVLDSAGRRRSPASLLKPGSGRPHHLTLSDRRHSQDAWAYLLDDDSPAAVAV
jgi:hypothetical protein